MQDLPIILDPVYFVKGQPPIRTGLKLALWRLQLKLYSINYYFEIRIRNTVKNGTSKQTAKPCDESNIAYILSITCSI